MKYTFSLLLFCFSFVCFSADFTLSTIQGMKDKKDNMFFKVLDYEVYISTVKGRADNPKILRSIRKKYKLKDSVEVYTDSLLKCKVIENIDTLSLVNQHYYILPDTDKQTYCILFASYNQLNVDLERQLVRQFMDNRLSDYLTTGLSADSIVFAGRKIYLGNACNWMAPQNVFCKGGQVSWSYFSNYEAASVDINSRIGNAIAENSVLEESEIEVLFDGVPTIAYRVVYPAKSRYFPYPLIVYYVATEVRGYYVSCVLSNYGDSTNDYQLADLLQEFMFIPNMPQDVHNKFDFPQYGIEGDLHRNISPYRNINFDIRFLYATPLGNMKDIFNAGYGVGIYMGGSLSKSVSMDFGLQFAIIDKSHKFNYYRKRENLSLRANSLIDLNLRVKYQYEWKRNVFIGGYFGFGYSAIQTDKKKNETDKNSAFHTVETLGIIPGATIRYKKIGYFLEYRYAPYSIGGKVRSSLGSSTLSTGVFVYL